MSFNELQEKLKEIAKDVADKQILLKNIELQLKRQERAITHVTDITNRKLGNIIEKDNFASFFKKPYVVHEFGKNQIFVFVPKFIKNFQVGWLYKEDETFYIYQLDQYSAWLGDVPQELLEKINFQKEIDATVEGDTLFFSPTDKEKIKKKFLHLTDFQENQARITKGHIFDLIVQMIESNCLPFKPKKVSLADLRGAKAKFEVREYQKPAVDKFMETGAVGIFYPTGAGKSFIAMHLLDTIKGKKLIIVPGLTLAEQWEYYIDTWIPHVKDEITISTYQGMQYQDQDFVLTIYDECQRLPANTFSRLAVINTKYRIGLSASPHREDGRESYIFALTGYPIGLNWRDYMKTVGKTFHPIYVHLVKHGHAKMLKLKQLLDRDKKTFIFCDTIELGQNISRTLQIPFIYGETKDRLNEIEQNKVVVISRVGDLGISIPDLERIIEVDFLFGSRQQELQRTGRLMHSQQKDVRHDIIMTEKEKMEYGKRLWALQEKGFHLKVVS